MAGHERVVQWLVGVDPSVHWQVLRDLLGQSPDAWAPVRQQVETDGWGARLLALEDDDGQWAGGSFLPRGFTRREWEEEGQPWTATTYAISQLRELGLDPASAAARRMVQLVGENARWDHDGEPFWSGEVEECINGRTVADGAYFGVDVSALVERLAGERLHDGGWNCERAAGSVRSSFDSTVNVLEGLAQYERATGGTTASREARASGEEFLLERRLFRRLSTGEPADPTFLELLHPTRWHYDVLRALDHFRDTASLTGARPDPRLDEAVGWLRSRRSPDGTWPLDRTLPGRTWFDLDDGVGRPSSWVTLKAMRVLAWVDAG